MKKYLLITLIFIIYSSYLMPYMISVKSGQELIGDIIKSTSEYVYFVDSRNPRILIIIDKNWINAVFSGDLDVTHDILFYDKEAEIDYNSYSKIIDLNEQFPTAPLTRENIIKDNPYRKPILLIKSSLEFGDLILSDSNDYDIIDTKFGVSVSGEIFSRIYKRIYIGVGSTYQFKRTIEMGGHQLDIGFGHFAIYGLTRLDLNNYKGFEHYYIFMNLGYSILDGNIFISSVEPEGDLYFGAGFGVQIGSKILEISYKNFGSFYLYDETKESNKFYSDYRIGSISFGLLTF